MLRLLFRGMQVIRAIVGLGAALVLAGCVSTKNVKADIGALQHNQYRTITVSAREKPSFSAMTAGKAQFGVIGAAAMIAAGNKIIRDNNVADPAVYIGEQLAGVVAANLGVQLAGNSGQIASSTKPRELAAQYSGSDLLMDVQTVNWQFAYFPLDWNNYRVIYSAKVRLIDTRTRKLLAEGFCVNMPERSEESPSRDQLLDNGAEGLKRELKAAADRCIPQLAWNVLGVDGRALPGR